MKFSMLTLCNTIIYMFITDPSVMKDTWRLTDGFVAEEGKALLPHMAKIR
jgi:hypothetical protein